MADPDQRPPPRVPQLSMGTLAGERSSYAVVGLWDAGDPNLSLLNQETPKDLPLMMSIGIDLVIGKTTPNQPPRGWSIERCGSHLGMQ